MMADKLRWYRVEYDAKGRQISKELAVSERDDTGLIFFVCARDANHADKLGRRQVQIAMQRARRAKNKLAGLCPDCGRPRTDGFFYCQVCREGNDANRKRNLAKARGENVSDKPPKSVAHQKRLNADRARIRAELEVEVREEVTVKIRAEVKKTLAKKIRYEITMQVLDEVRRAWQRLANVGQFNKWLRTQVQDTVEKEEAA